MARLLMGEYDANLEQVFLTLSYHPGGLKESELAAVLGWERRRLNNYLHILEQQGRIYRDGQIWQVEP